MKIFPDVMLILVSLIAVFIISIYQHSNIQNLQSTVVVLETQLQQYKEFKDTVFSTFCRYRVGDTMAVNNGTGTVVARSMSLVLAIYDVRMPDNTIVRIYASDHTGVVEE